MFNLKKYFQKPLPAILFGMRLKVRTSAGLPENQLVVLVNPKKFARVEERLGRAFMKLKAYDDSENWGN